MKRFLKPILIWRKQMWGKHWRMRLGVPRRLKFHLQHDALLIDMNLSPEWVVFFQKENMEVIHWSTIGDARATDTEIFAYVKENHYIVFTHDLDFGAILAATNADAPSDRHIPKTPCPQHSA